MSCSRFSLPFAYAENPLPLPLTRCDCCAPLIFPFCPSPSLICAPDHRLKVTLLKRRKIPFTHLFQLPPLLHSLVSALCGRGASSLSLRCPPSDAFTVVEEQRRQIGEQIKLKLYQQKKEIGKRCASFLVVVVFAAHTDTNADSRPIFTPPLFLASLGLLSSHTSLLLACQTCERVYTFSSSFFLLFYVCTPFFGTIPLFLSLLAAFLPLALLFD